MQLADASFKPGQGRLVGSRGVCQGQEGVPQLLDERLPARAGEVMGYWVEATGEQAAGMQACQRTPS